MSIKRKVAGKAVRKTAKHSTHGAAAKLKREPLRTTALLSLGALVGFGLGRLSFARGGFPAPEHG